ncbi:EAL domain-containing protein [Thalassotalea nanhaiensis]|uniref:EAL domain-containing protein n=1 Tax=Thalassotalea nanhaiensis TaxID=3065648 RepID=A0ABY9TJD1_9GAMM|nr:EAL domain-containing protein [Colwelliaceae bacterium SQ345]
MTGRKISAIQKLKSLLTQYKQTKKVQTGLLKLSELCCLVTDMSAFYPALQKIIQQHFPAENLYIQLYTQANSDQAEHFYIDELNCSPIEQQLTPDIIDFINNIPNPVLINHDQVSILNNDNSINERPFPTRTRQTHLIDVWLAAPLLVEGLTIGIVGVKGFINPNHKAQTNLELIKFIATLIAAAIHRNRANEQLKLYSKDIEDIIFDRTQNLQKSNFNLRQQVEQRRKSELKLYYDAHHDALTKLPNRAMFTDRLEQSIKHLKRHINHRFGVLFIDIDRFKVINDTLGHHVGDELLIQIADRILECIRSNDIVSRLGGDEFVVLLDTLAHSDDAEDIANRIIETIKQPFTIDNQQLFSSASIGIAICDQHYKQASDVLRDADAAMYQAKSMGRGRFMFFDESMREELLANLSLEQDLRQAVNNQEFILHYQKISELIGSDTIGYEALLRWQHPTKGLMSPTSFLELAEETGLIIDIENWVVESVAKQIKLWDEQPEDKGSFVSINLSGKHILQTKPVQQLSKLIQQHFNEPERLIIEFNEKAFNEQSERSLKNLKILKKTGVKLALDDYGSGQSSLNYLNNYPFEFIKLEQNFVRSFSTNMKNWELAKSLAALGESFGFRLVAEGIESQAQLEKVIAAGCEYGQGFYISKPKAIEADEPDNDVNHCA